MKLNSLALFDFDGTITTDDSLTRFISFVVGDARLIIGMLLLSPILLSYKLKLTPNHKAKQIVLSYFFKGMEESSFRRIARQYSLEQIDKIVRPEALERIKWHKRQGHKVVVVSASIECWLKPWCDKNDLDLIATKLEFRDGAATGRFLTKNCHGMEKVNRIKAAYDPDDYESIHAYGDSAGDKEMLAIATNRYYKYFHKLSREKS